MPFPQEDERWGSSIPATYDVPDVPTSPWVNDIPRSPPVQAPQDDEWEAAKREKEQLNKKVASNFPSFFIYRVSAANPPVFSHQRS